MADNTPGRVSRPGDVSRRVRNTTNIRKWPLRTKIAVGVWIPVVIVAIALFTGPNRSSSAAPAPTTTTTSFTNPVIAEPIVPPNTAPNTSLQERIGKWIQGVPTKRTPAQREALLKYRKAHSHVGGKPATTVIVRPHASGLKKSAKAASPLGK